MNEKNENHPTQIIPAMLRIFQPYSTVQKVLGHPFWGFSTKMSYLSPTWTNQIKILIYNRTRWYKSHAGFENQPCKPEVQIEPYVHGTYYISPKFL